MTEDMLSQFEEWAQKAPLCSGRWRSQAVAASTIKTPWDISYCIKKSM
jgi:hypothetical protein